MMLQRLRRHGGVIGFAAVLAMVIAVRFAEPILDGDLFWHMAYARQMIEGRTLIPDQTLYSWTPAAKGIIYCSWLAELVLCGLYHVFGLAGIFSLRYVCVVGVIASAWQYGRKAGLRSSADTIGRRAAMALILMVLTAGIYAGSIPKPEIFSLVLFQALLWCLFSWKLDGNWRWLAAMPLLMLVWENAHGGFILAAPLLISAILGETLNSRKLPKELILSAAACILVSPLTPYLWKYPQYLIRDYALREVPRPDEAWNSAMQTILSPAGQYGHYIELLAWMALILTVLFIRTRRFDWTVLLANLVYVPLFVRYLRSSAYLPEVFAYSAMYLLGAKPRARFLKFARTRWVEASAAAGFLLLAVEVTFGAIAHPAYGSWTGFGVGYANPVAEAQFVDQSNLSGRMYNLFDTGGYLLWRLYPKDRVMVDSRSYPYLSWFSDQREFTMGRNTAYFFAKYPADFAVIELAYEPLWRQFLRSPDWKAIFCGPSAAVFVKTQASEQAKLPLEFAPAGRIRNAQSALRMFYFARAVGDFDVTWAALDQAERHLSWQDAGPDLDSARAYRDEQFALEAGDWAKARALFRTAFEGKEQNERDRLVDFLLQSVEALQRQGKPAAASPFPAALRKLAVPEHRDPSVR